MYTNSTVEDVLITWFYTMMDKFADLSFRYEYNQLRNVYTVSYDASTDVMNNDDVVEIIYKFIKTKITIMDLGQLSEDNPKIQRFTKLVTSVQNEIKNNITSTP